MSHRPDALFVIGGCQLLLENKTWIQEWIPIRDIRNIIYSYVEWFPISVAETPLSGDLAIPCECCNKRVATRQMKLVECISEVPEARDWPVPWCASCSQHVCLKYPLPVTVSKKCTFCNRPADSQSAICFDGGAKWFSFCNVHREEIPEWIYTGRPLLVSSQKDWHPKEILQSFPGILLFIAILCRINLPLFL